MAALNVGNMCHTSILENLKVEYEKTGITPES
jgi:hypothetical protein